ncbi:unnamed protein product, partial [marine sediment metagenome]
MIAAAPVKQAAAAEHEVAIVGTRAVAIITRMSTPITLL